MQYEIKPPDTGGILLSYKCNSKCRHCLYGGAPDWNEWIDTHDAVSIFEGIHKTTRFPRAFHLAGGEPFLDFDRLLRIQRLATEFRIPIEYVETNVSWCTNELLARERFEQLRDAGLKCVLVSCSPFHAERIPLEYVVTAIKVGYEVFGPGGVMVWVPEFYRELSRIRTDRTIRLEEYIESVGDSAAKYMIRSGYSLITGGRVGFNLAEYFERRPAECCEGDRCHPELLDSGHAHFDPYGNYIPAFCSGISLGNAFDLKATIDGFDIDRYPLVKMLVDGGPYQLYRFARSEFGYEPIRDGYIGKCHLCTDVRKWIVERSDKYAELQPVGFYGRLSL